MDLGNGLSIQLAVYLVAEVFSSEKETVTLLPLSMVGISVMAQREKIVPAEKSNAQVAWESFIFIITYISCLLIPSNYIEIILTLIYLKSQRKLASLPNSINYEFFRLIFFVNGKYFLIVNDFQWHCWGLLTVNENY